MFTLAAPVAAAQSSGSAFLDDSARELVPYGQAVGTYTAPTQFASGEMVALLEDASGVPLWIMQAEILPGGNVNGELNLLKYGSNPAQQLPPLEVHGRVTLDANGAGSFSASLYSAFLGQAGEPMGRVVGALKPKPLGVNAPLFTSSTGLVAYEVSNDEAERMFRLGECLLPPVSARDAYYGRDGRKIVVTHSSGVAISEVELVGSMSQAGQASTDDQDATSAGPMDDGSIVPDGVEGEMSLRWWLYT